MSGIMFAIAYILLVYLALGFFKVANNGSYEKYSTYNKNIKHEEKNNGR